MAPSVLFDTVDHELLLLRLERQFGLRGTVLAWFGSGRKELRSGDGAVYKCLDLFTWKAIRSLLVCVLLQHLLANVGLLHCRIL